MKRGAKPIPRGAGFSDCSRRAFTLIELMLVVGIIGLVMALGAPTLYKMWHKEGFRKTMSDIVDVCGAARARAILLGVTAEVAFHPRDGRCELVGDAAPGSGMLAHSATFDPHALEMLDVNLQDCRELEEVRVKFYPNGTCDEMLFIIHSEKNEQRGVSLEITTSLATLLNEEDIRNLLRRRL